MRHFSENPPKCRICSSVASRNALVEIGHELGIVVNDDYFGKVEAILINDGVIEIAADPRADDWAMGY